MKKKLKAVLFDMDGVLFDSMPYHSEAWHTVMKSHGLTLSREEALHLIYPEPKALTATRLYILHLKPP